MEELTLEYRARKLFNSLLSKDKYKDEIVMAIIFKVMSDMMRGDKL